MSTRSRILLLALGGVVVLLFVWLVPTGGEVDRTTIATQPDQSAPVLRGVEKARDAPTSDAPASPPAEDVRGTVVDADGAPVSGASVRLQAAETTSDGSGAFSLPLPAFDGQGLAGTLIAAKPGYGTGQVSMYRDQEQPVRIILPHAAEISGIVMSATGPVPDAKVTLRDGAVASTVVTDAGGRFRLPSARMNRCTLVASATGYYPELVQADAHVRSREVQIWLRPTPDVSLYIADAGGRPLAGAHVTAHWQQEAEARLTGTSDQNGFAMRIPALDGPSSVTVSCPGCAAQDHALPQHIDEDITIRLRKHEPLVVRLPPDTPPADRASWSVALASNRPAGGDHGPPHYGKSPARIGFADESTWTGFNDEGMASLPDVVVGTACSIVAVRRGARGDEHSLRLVIWRTSSVPPSPRVIDWTPPRMAELVVRTVDPRAHNAVPVPLHVQAASDLDEHAESLPSGRVHSLHVRTGEDGEVRLFLWPGSYTIRAITGGAFEQTTIDLPAAGRQVELAVARGHDVSGRLVTHDGIPLPQRPITCSNSMSSHVAMTDDAGRFMLERLPAGTYTLHFGGEHGASLHGPETLKVPTAAPLLLTTHSYELRGTVVPTPSPPDVVWMRRKHDLTWFAVPVDKDGGFRREGLSAGPWVLQVRKVVDGKTEIAAEQEVVLTERGHVQIYAD